MSIYNEIYTLKDTSVSDLFSKLCPEERVFIYLMSRAILPFNRIFRDQNHYANNQIIEMMETLYQSRSLLDADLVKDIETYLVYLWTNHGIYFLRDNCDQKRTPSKIGLTHLTPQNLSLALEKLNLGTYKKLFPIIFDKDVDSEMTVEGSIEKSGNNFYGRGFTEEHYMSFPPEVRNSINAYFSLDSKGCPQVQYYSTSGKYGPELTVSVHWLTKALSHARSCPHIFDNHFVKSLELLIQYFETGKEELFKQHCIEWLQTRSHLDYTLGFIENYKDPKDIRGHAGGEVTIKTMNMERVNPILLSLEQTLPYPPEYMRSKNSKTTLNVSLNRLAFASGDYGPLKIIAAYCLPNYQDIRAEHGSKQVIYKFDKALEDILNPELVKEFRSSIRQAFVDKYDPKNEILSDLWDLQVLLHETIGHASGKLDKHIFTKTTQFHGQTYQPGDVIDVTDTNLSELLRSDQSSLEELRAEINALYMSVFETDIIAKENLCKDWVQKLGKTEFQKQCIIGMALHMFRRLQTQKENMNDIHGAHARANTVITNYLLHNGSIRIVDEVKTIQGKQYHILDIEVVDLDKACSCIKELCQLVQKIKSTGDGDACQELFGKYTKYPISIEQAQIYRQYIIDKRKCLTGETKIIARIYPNYQPVLKDGQIVDVVEGPVQNIVEQNLDYSKKMMSTS